MKQRQFKQTLEQYKDLIFSQAYYFTGNHDDAAEITQEVFMKLWTNIDAINRTTVKSWLLTVARNSCIDLIRRRRIVPESVLAGDPLTCSLVSELRDERPGPEQQAMALDVRSQLERALSLLHPTMRMAVILREIQQLSYQEVAQTLEIPLNTVKVYVHRAKKMMAAQLVRYQEKEENNELSRL